MKEIDFLPLSFHENLRLRHRTRRNLLYCLAVVTSLAVLHGLTTSSIRSAQASLNALRDGSNLRTTQRIRLEGLLHARTALQARAAMMGQLADDAPVDALLAEINRLMGPTTALRSISMKTATPEPGADKKEPDPIFQHGRTEGVLQGVAANDVEVGTFFGRLSACPFLDEVRLSYSREAQQAGRSMREFELKFAIRPVTISESPAK